MIDQLKLIEKNYDALQNKIIESHSDIKKMTELLKKSKQLEETVVVFREYKKIKEEYDELIPLIQIEKDKELSEMLLDEKSKLEKSIDNYLEKLKILLLPKDPHDDKNIVIEIKGAAGGDEGNIFAGDLFRMYQRYSESKGWKLEVLNTSEGSMGGFASIEFLISGENVYSFLKFEAGVHRVQRVPLTESQGRIHTSTATVLVMPEAEELEVDIKWEDIRFDTYNSSGPGGQSVNTTKSAVRLTHNPTGIVVSCQEGKSQHENREKAYKLLKTRIYDHFLTEQLEKEGETRKALVGRGDRSEKIRTYNYPQNRVTDHRYSITLQRLDAIMEGRLDLILTPFFNEYQKEQLEGKNL